jgi:hypothetical protein
MPLILQIISAVAALTGAAQPVVLELLKTIRVSRDQKDAAQKALSALAHERAVIEAARLTLKRK